MSRQNEAGSARANVLRAFSLRWRIKRPAGDERVRDAEATFCPLGQLATFVKCRSRRGSFPSPALFGPHPEPARVGADTPDPGAQGLCRLGVELARSAWIPERSAGVPDGSSVDATNPLTELPPSAARRSPPTHTEPDQAVLEADTNANIRATRWAGYPAITEYLDHAAPGHGKTAPDKAINRALRSLDGLAVKIKEKAFRPDRHWPRWGGLCPLPASTPPARAGAVARHPLKQPNGGCSLGG